LEAYRAQTGQIAIRDFLARQTGDFRILQLVEPNSAMYLRAQNIWGYGAIPSRRYLEFITFTQGGDPDQATQYVNFTQWPALYRMLRCKFGFVPGNKELQVLTMDNPMERLHLIQNHEVISGRDAIFRRMMRSDFDPRQTVIVESDPGLATSRDIASAGEVRIIKASRDRLEIEANVLSPAILLITDSYSPAWKIRGLEQSSTQPYRIVPANYILMGIPLTSGRHHFSIECIAPGYGAGKWVTVAAVSGWFLLLFGPKLRRSEAEAKQAPTKSARKDRQQ
jgi:hypothetical protein